MQYLEEVILILGSKFAFGSDADYCGLLMAQDFEDQTANDCEDMLCMAQSYSTFIFTVDDIHDPVDRIFDAPVAAGSIQELLGIRG